MNNPHFLIMQGRITKVLNMKPPEILGLIEEAAGTLMYEAKKLAAQKTIEKKAEKVAEISKVLADEITPTLQKLREDKRTYLMWAQGNTEAERLGRFCVAHDFMQQDELRAGGAARAAAIEAAIAEAVAQVAAMRRAAEAKDRELEAAKAAVKKGADLSDLEKEASGLRMELTKAEAALKHKRDAQAEAEKALAAATRGEREAGAALDKLAAREKAQREEGAASAAASARLRGELATLQDRLVRVAAGYAADEPQAGGGAGAAAASPASAAAAAAAAAAAENDTVAGMLMTTRKAVTDLGADVTQREMKAKHLKARAKEVGASAKAAEKDAQGLQQQAAQAAQQLESKRRELAALGFDPKADEALRAQREALAAQAAQMAERHEADFAGVSALVEFQYERGGLGASWSDSRVRGTVASLLSVERREAAQALEVCAGGKLYQVVVDTEVTGKLLLEKGRLRRRVTIVPLNQIRGRAASAAQVAAAAAISGGGAVPALSLVRFAPEVARAMEYVFGDTFICDTPEIARAVCFDSRVRCPCVTLAGDVFDPAGTLEGGSPPSSAGGEALLLRLRRVVELGEQLAAVRQQLAAAEAGVAAAAKARKEHARLAGEAELSAHQAELMQQRLSASTLGQLQQRLRDTEAELAAEEAGILDSRARCKAAEARARELEAELKNASAAREKRVAAVEAEIARTKKAAAEAEAKARKLAQAADEAACELESGRREREGSAGALSACEAARASAGLEVGAAQARAAEAETRFGGAKARLDAANEARAAADKAVQSLAKERAKCVSDAEDAELAAKRGARDLEASRAESAGAARAVAELLQRHAWIAGERQFFGQSHTDYDFKKTDPKAQHAKLREVEKRQAELERRINKKVVGMIDSAEREFADLTGKKAIIENDKEKIEKVIEELDVKKNEALQETWAKVNRSFGDIFKTLLPGTSAKLQPPDGSRSVLDGLEVKVAFNGVWKESLTELSGGQRSLLALSIILALLMFKPAPMYILDEVDAALDLSHTQNIGHMIRTYFGKSQFIVVSLKQGMFSNANVIFRTKFVDGTSTVTRTVPATSSLVGGHMGQPHQLEDENEGAAAAATKGAGAGAGGKGAKAALRA